MKNLWEKQKNIFDISFDGEDISVNENSEEVINFTPSHMSGGGGGGGGGSR